MIITRGRLTCAFKPASSEMFRLASSKLLGFYGTNLQNPTDSLMSCVIPSDGYKFGQPDQAGAEALIVAMEARPGKFRRLFELGIKPHSYMALQIFTDKFRKGRPAERYKGVDPDTLKGYEETKELLNTIKHAADEYFLGKKTIHSFNYDEGPRTFQLTTLKESEGKIVLSFKQSKEFRDIWSKSFSEVPEWQNETIAKAKKDKVLRNLFGYPRLFERTWNDDVGRKSLAFVPQSTVACITHMAYTELYYRIKKERLPWTLLNNKHDSLLCEFPDNKEHEEMFIAYSKEHMGRELISSRGEHYRMKVGISFAQGNWGHYNEKTNPGGMREI